MEVLFKEMLLLAFHKMKLENISSPVMNVWLQGQVNG